MEPDEVIVAPVMTAKLISMKEERVGAPAAQGLDQRKNSLTTPECVPMSASRSGKYGRPVPALVLPPYF